MHFDITTTVDLGVLFIHLPSHKFTIYYRVPDSVTCFITILSVLRLQSPWDKTFASELSI